MKQIVEERVPKAMMLKDLIAGLIDSGRQMRTLLLAKDETEVATVKGKIRLIRAHDRELTTKSDKMINSDMGCQLFKEVSDKRDALALQFYAFFALTKNPRAEAIDYLSTEFLPLDTTYGTGLNALA